MMQTRQYHSRAKRNRLGLAVACAALFATAETAQAATGQWTNVAGGSWGLNTNWASSVIADGAGFNANFTGADLVTSNKTVTLDMARTIGNISIGDSSSADARSYTLAPGGFSLTMDNSGSASTITQTSTSNGDTINIPLILNNNLNLTNNSTTAQLSLTGIISESGGARALTVQGSGGSVALGAANTFTGGVTLNSSGLMLNVAGALSTGTLTINGGTLGNSSGGAITLSTNNTQLWNGNFTFGGSQNLNLGTGSVTLNANRTISVGSSSDTLTVGGIIGDSGSGFSLSTTNATANDITGVVVLSGANTYSGGTNINGGLVRFNSGAAIPGTGNITIGLDGALSVSGAHTTLATWLANPKLQTTSTGALSLAGDSAEAFNPGAFTTLSLGANIGATVIYTGTITPASTTYRLGGGGGTLNLANTDALAAGNDLIVGNGGGGTVIVAADNANFNGAVTVANGTLQLGNAGTAGSLGNASGITNNSAIVFNRTDSSNFGNVISGAGTITKAGAGTITLTATQTYTGTLTLSTGTLALSGANDRLPTSAPFVLAGGTLDVGATSQTLTNFALPNATMTGNIIGTGGTLNLTQATLNLGPASTANPTTVNMTGLSNLIYNNSAGTFRVGPTTTSTGITTQVATVTLGTNNTITATNLNVADLALSSNTGSSTLNLGQTNALNVTNFNIGFSGRSNGVLKFATGLTNPTVTIRGATGGTSFATSMSIGNVANNGTATWTSSVDFTAGTVDANITTMTVGSAATGGTALRRGTQFGNYLMGKGTLNVGTLVIGTISGTATINGTDAYGATGNVTINDATGVINATTITLATNTITTATGGTKSVAGNLNLTDGTILATTIQRGTQGGTASVVTANLNFTAGTLGNTPGADLSITNVPITLLTSAAHNFNISGTNSATLAATAPISGTGFGITKLGTGSLILNAANTYTGTTTISAGLLVVGGSTTSNTDVQLAGTLGGTGTITGNVTGAGTVAPGNSIGTLNVVGDYNVTGTHSMEISKSAGPVLTADLLNITGNLTYDGNLRITIPGAELATLSVGDTWNLFDASLASSGSFDNNAVFGTAGDGTFLPVLGSGLAWNFNYGSGELSVIAAIPEPSTFVLGGLALLGFAGVGLRRRRAAKN